MDFGKRYAVEPLGDYFVSKPILTEVRNPDVTYLTGRGESLPFESNFSDLVIIDNVLDHTENPGTVLREAHRLLHDNGLLYLGVNIRSAWGTFLHKTINKLNLDMGHPYEYDHAGIQTFLSRHGFQIIWETVEDRGVIRKKCLYKEGIKGKIKVVSGLVEFYYEAFCEKI